MSEASEVEVEIVALLIKRAWRVPLSQYECAKLEGIERDVVKNIERRALKKMRAAGRRDDE